MIITTLNQDLINEVEQLMSLRRPFVRARSQSDYWLYAHLFSSTCPIVLMEGKVGGVVIAFRDQENPKEIYVQDLMVHPAHRKKGIAKKLMTRIQERAMDWDCTRIWLTSEVENTAAQALWSSMGYCNKEGDKIADGVSLVTDFKGKGRDRAVYELFLRI
jgi:ribosomal protein S18 acetylase RimI-like enzyme